MSSLRACPLLGACMALLACAAGPTEITAAAGTSPAPSCAQRVATMRGVLASVPTAVEDLAIMNLPDGMELPDSARGEPLADGLPLFIRADGSLLFDNESYATAQAFGLPRRDPGAEPYIGGA